MTWQDTNREAYETRLRERWTPDGERKYPIIDPLRWETVDSCIKDDYVVEYANSDACRDAMDKLRDAMNEPSPIWDNK